METLQINYGNAIKAYDSADENGKKLLENLFGKKVFLKSITERIKSFDDVLKELDLNKSDFENSCKGLELDEIAYKKAKLVCQAYNEGWIPNWDDSSEYKYYPYFDMRSSASGGFAYDDCADWYSFSLVGSRLCFKSSELAKYAGELFDQEIYKPLFTLKS